MITVANQMDAGKRLKLDRAILLYRAEEGAVASLHQVHPNEGQDGELGGCEIGAGRPLTREALSEITRDLAGLPQQRELIPSHILFADGSCTLWHRPAARHPVFFHTGDKSFDADTNGKQALYPPLLFLARPQHLFVWALASGERPTLATPLYRAPFLNIYETGHMCSGTAKLPLVVGMEVAPFERSFFETTFTHSNLRDKLTAHPGGHNALWRKLVQPDTEEFCSDWLVPLHKEHGKKRVALTVEAALATGQAALR